MIPSTFIKVELLPDNTVHLHGCLASEFDTNLKYQSKEQLNGIVAGNGLQILWYHLEKYIKHSAVIIRHSNGYKPAIIDSLLRCEEFLKWIQENNNYAFGLVNNTLKMYNHLFAILPCSSNTSYATSLAKLSSIMMTASYLKEKVWQE